MRRFASLRYAACLAVLAGAVTYASEASASLITVNSVGDTFGVTFDGNVNGSNVPGLSAHATFVVTAFSSTSATFNVTLTNTSGAPITDSRVSALGFDTTPTITGGSVTGVYDMLEFGGQMFPNGFGSIEACVKAGGGPNCTGGGGGGVGFGGSSSFLLTLNYSSSMTFSFDKFGVRYQSIVGAAGGSSGTGTGTVDRLTPVPEPTTLVLFGTGLLGSVALRRRRAAQK